jgi:hypothetical protein
LAHRRRVFLFEIPHSFASEYVAALKSASISFCEECFAARCDPDQTLLLENRLAKYEPTHPYEIKIDSEKRGSGDSLD